MSQKIPCGKVADLIIKLQALDPNQEIDVSQKIESIFSEVEISKIREI